MSGGYCTGGYCTSSSVLTTVNDWNWQRGQSFREIRCSKTRYLIEASLSKIPDPLKMSPQSRNRTNLIVPFTTKKSIYTRIRRTFWDTAYRTRIWLFDISFSSFTTEPNHNSEAVWEPTQPIYSSHKCQSYETDSDKLAAISYFVVHKFRRNKFLWTNSAKSVLSPE